MYDHPFSRSMDVISRSAAGGWDSLVLGSAWLAHSYLGWWAGEQWSPKLCLLVFSLLSLPQGRIEKMNETLWNPRANVTAAEEARLNPASQCRYSSDDWDLGGTSIGWHRSKVEGTLKHFHLPWGKLLSLWSIVSGSSPPTSFNLARAVLSPFPAWEHRLCPSLLLLRSSFPSSLSPRPPDTTTSLHTLHPENPKYEHKYQSRKASSQNVRMNS